MAKTLKQAVYDGFLRALSAVFGVQNALLGRFRFLKSAYYRSLPRQLVTASHDGLSYVMDSGDKVIAQGLYVHGHYDVEKAVQAFRIAKVDAGNSVFVDIGANIGCICLPVIRNGLASRAIAIEPDALNVRLLKANIVLNGFDDRVVVHHTAVGAKERETLIFELSEENYGDHRISLGTQDGQYNESRRKRVEVPSTTLDRVLADASDQKLFLWLDTQGYEGHILSGAALTLARHFPMVLEFWPYGMERAASYGLLKAALLSAGYAVFYDLAEPDPQPKALNEANLDALYEALAARETYSDILITV